MNAPFSTIQWVAIGQLSDIPVRGARCVVTPMGKIGVFRTAADEVFAIEDHCPHKGGLVHGRSVTCPLHNWVIDLQTGKAQGADDGNVATLPVRVGDNGVLELGLEPSSLTASIGD